MWGWEIRGDAECWNSLMWHSGAETSLIKGLWWGYRGSCHGANSSVTPHPPVSPDIFLFLHSTSNCLPSQLQSWCHSNTIITSLSKKEKKLQSRLLDPLQSRMQSPSAVINTTQRALRHRCKGMEVVGGGNMEKWPSRLSNTSVKKKKKVQWPTEFMLSYQHMLKRWSGSISVKEVRRSDPMRATGSTWPSLLSFQRQRTGACQNKGLHPTVIFPVD